MTDIDIDPPAAPSPFNDNELVYVDPETRTVVGRVEWNKSGNPKSLAIPPKVETKEKNGRRSGGGRKYYPWGTYRSMKHVYRLEGKQKKTDPNKTLDDIMQKALQQPFWD